MLSVVVPVYGAPEQLENLIAALANHLCDTENEVILVVDACPSGSWDVITSLDLNLHRTQIIALHISKNIGQHRAIWEGLRHSSGDRIIVMDCDMQDDPRHIKALLGHLSKYEAVVASRSNRQDSFLKKLTSKVFWKYISFMTGLEFDGSVANFGAYRRSLINKVIASEGNSPFFPIEVKSLSTSSIQVPVQHQKRLTGKSSYTLGKLFILAATATISFSKKPFNFILSLGFLALLTTALISIILLVFSFLGKFSVEGWASVVLLVSFWGSLQVISIGVVGLYTLEIFEKSNNKKRVFVDEKLTINQEVK